MLIDIYKYWFSNPKCWFSSTYDQELKELFLNDYQNLSQDYEHLLRNLRYEMKNYNPNQLNMIKSNILGFIILFDQIPRNIFRGTPQAYENDTLVSTFVKELFKIIDNKFSFFTPDEFNFLILPLIHLEDETLENIKYAFELTQTYWKTLPQPLTKFANIKKNKMLINIIKHQDLLKKFGRYPLRNPILNRESTIAETLYISQNKNRMF